MKKQSLVLLVLPALLFTACGGPGKGLKRVDIYTGTNPGDAVHNEYTIYARNGNGFINHINNYRINPDDKKFYFYSNAEYTVDTDLKQDYTIKIFKEDGKTIREISHVITEKDEHGQNKLFLQEKINPVTSERTIIGHMEYINTYNQKGNLAQTITKDKIRERTTMDDYSYDDSNRETDHVCYYMEKGGTEFKKMEKYHFEYLKNTNLITKTEHYVPAQDNVWVLNRTTTFTYDNNNLLVKHEIQDTLEDGTNVIMFSKTIIIESKNTSSVTQSRENTDAELKVTEIDEKEYADEYKSDKQKPIKLINITYNVDQEPYEKTLCTYSYNENGEMLEETAQFQRIDEGDWKNLKYTRNVYQY